MPQILRSTTDAPETASATSLREASRILPIVPPNKRDESHGKYGRRGHRGKFRKLRRKMRRKTTTRTPIMGDESVSTTLVKYSSCLPTYGITLTVIGVVLLDCCCDACQSPCRTYLLDVSQPEDHAAGLATFTVMAGLGGSVGYLLSGVVDWQTTGFGTSLGGHVQVYLRQPSIFMPPPDILCFRSARYLSVILRFCLSVSMSAKLRRC